MLKSSRSSPRLKQVRGPSTPLGMRLAALRMTESEKSHSDDAAMCCSFEAAKRRLRSHAPARLKDCRAILEMGEPSAYSAAPRRSLSFPTTDGRRLLSVNPTLLDRVRHAVDGQHVGRYAIVHVVC